MTLLYLKPILESPRDFDKIEEKLKLLWRQSIFLPIVIELGVKSERRLKTVLNSSTEALQEAIRSGQIEFHQGRFTGKFGFEITRALRGLGAEWDSRSKSYRITLDRLPYDVRAAISGSFTRFQQKIDAIDDKLAKILPEEIAGRLQISQLFDQTLWKTDREFQATVKGVAVTPELTPEQRKKIADEWQNNMRLWVKDFTAQEIVKLREQIQKSVFAGNRYESAIATIRKSFAVTMNKAKFLARQETGLLMAKFTESRYQAAGVSEYKWGCVAGSKLHPVRPAHKALEGKIFSWDNPPITSAPNEPVRRNNPKQDYNCRCYAIPIVRFNKDE